jgi:hypothetical protein
LLTVWAGLATPAWAAGDPTAYIQAWQTGDASALVRSVGTATYFDGDWSKTIATSDLPATMAAYRGRPLILVSQVNQGDSVTLSWSWQADGTVDYTDTLTYDDGTLRRVVTKGVVATPAQSAWAQAFEAARRDRSDAVFRPFFAPDARIFGRNFPADGATVDAYLDLLATLSGTVYKRLPNSPVRRAKDGHLYYDFEVRYASGTVLVAGRDHVYLRDGLVERLIGVY